MARPFESLPLLHEEGSAAPRAGTVAVPRSRQLWIAVCLQDLPLRAVDPLGNERQRPLVVVDPVDARAGIIGVNTAAHHSGIAPGMKLSAALALTGSLGVVERSVRVERELLTALAAFAHELTPVVSLEWPDSLLLEIRGSLKLMGGLQAIKVRLATELERRRLSFRMGAAATPLAALWLSGLDGGDAPDTSLLADCLSVLPLTATRWPADIRALLAEMGVHTVGDCLRLPRDGFARRVGKRYLRQLDQALGRQPDLRSEFVIEPDVSSTVEFSGEINDVAVLISALHSAIACITTELRRRQSETLKLSVVFHHAHRSTTRSDLQLLEPTYQARRLLDPLVARLEQTVLPAPVIALTVHADVAGEIHIEESSLFPDFATPERSRASRVALVEGLRARLGTEGVHGLELVPEHRPERVWKKLIEKLLRDRAATAPFTCVGADRPLWLLPVPRRLPSTLAEKYQRMILDDRSIEPERLEGGWWDGNDIRRDYYAIRVERGQRVWIYQDHCTRDWFLHGFFG
jgi:protein ImuB